MTHTPPPDGATAGRRAPFQDDNHAGGARRLLVFGEILWDMLPSGPQPGGGSANAAVLAHATGVNAMLASAVGDDARGDEMLGRLRARNFPLDGIQRIAGAKTGIVDVVLTGRGIPSYHIHTDTAWDRIAMTPALRDAAPLADAFYFDSLTQRAPVSRATLRELLRLARPGCLRFFEVNLRTPWPAVDVMDESLAFADVLKLNHEELPLLAGWLGLPADEDGFVAGVYARYPARVVLLTKGPQGAVVFEHGAAPVFVPADDPGREIVDTVGAGDAFSAGFLAGRLRGMSNADATRCGSALAARVCATAGAWLEPQPM